MLTSLTGSPPSTRRRPCRSSASEEDERLLRRVFASSRGPAPRPALRRRRSLPPRRAARRRPPPRRRRDRLRRALRPDAPGHARRLDDSGMTWTEFRDEYHAWTTRIELPAGRGLARVRAPVRRREHAATGPPGRALTRSSRRSGAGPRSGSRRRKTATRSEPPPPMRGFSAFAPPCSLLAKGTSENQGGYDQSTLDELDAAIAAAREGRFEPLAAFTGWARPRHCAPRRRLPGHRVLSSGGSGASRRSLHRRAERPAVPASEAGAEYAAVLRTLGLPQSAHGGTGRRRTTGA